MSSLGHFFSFFDFRVLGRGKVWVEMEISMEGGGEGCFWSGVGQFFLIIFSRVIGEVEVGQRSKF